MKPSCIALAGVLGFLCGSQEAAAVVITPTVTIPDVQYAGFEATSYWDAGKFEYSQGTDNLTASGPTSNSRGGGATGSAFASYSTSLSTPMLAASASASGNDPFHPSSATASISLDYYFVATGPGPAAVVDISAKGFGSGIVGGATAREALVVIAPALFGATHVYASPYFDWTANTAFSVFTGQVYDVHMNVQIIAGANGAPDALQAATATIDPQFFIDPGNPHADQFGLFFSKGIVNLPVPVPAALPLFAAGLGVLGFCGAYRTGSAGADGSGMPVPAQAG